MDPLSLPWLYIPIFILFGCVFDTYATEVLVHYTSGGQGYEGFRWHRNPVSRFLLGRATAQFMDRRSLLFPCIEIGTAVFLTACVSRFGLVSLATAEAVVGAAIVVSASLINIKTGVLPARTTDVLIGSGAFFALLQGVFVDLNSMFHRLEGLAVALWMVIFLRWTFTRALGQEALGLGDVHMMAGISLYLGWFWFVIFFFTWAEFLLLWGIGRLILYRTQQLHTGPGYIATFVCIILRPAWVYDACAPFDEFPVLRLVFAAGGAGIILVMASVFRLFRMRRDRV